MAKAPCPWSGHHRALRHIVIGFEHEGEARRFMADMRQRMEKFALSLHPEKTRLIEFGRYAAERRARRGLGKPGTFNFLGFTHISGRSSRGGFQLKRQTRRDRMRARLRAIKEGSEKSRSAVAACWL
jgi:RNA-directed DNA polymerase